MNNSYADSYVDNLRAGATRTIADLAAIAGILAETVTKATATGTIDADGELTPVIDHMRRVADSLAADERGH